MVEFIRELVNIGHWDRCIVRVRGEYMLVETIRYSNGTWDSYAYPCDVNGYCTVHNRTIHGAYPRCQVFRNLETT